MEPLRRAKDRIYKKDNDVISTCFQCVANSAAVICPSSVSRSLRYYVILRTPCDDRTMEPTEIRTSPSDIFESCCAARREKVVISHPSIILFLSVLPNVFCPSPDHLVQNPWTIIVELASAQYIRMTTLPQLPCMASQRHEQTIFDDNNQMNDFRHPSNLESGGGNMRRLNQFLD